MLKVFPMPTKLNSVSKAQTVLFTIEWCEPEVRPFGSHNRNVDIKWSKEQIAMAWHGKQKAMRTLNERGFKYAYNVWLE